MRDIAFEEEAIRQLEAFLAGVGFGPRLVRGPVEMAGDAIAVHVDPVRNDMPFMMPDRCPWSYELWPLPN